MNIVTYNNSYREVNTFKGKHSFSQKILSIVEIFVLHNLYLIKKIILKINGVFILFKKNVDVD